VDVVNPSPQTFYYVDPISLGEHSYISEFCHIAQHTEIGKFCSIGNLCTIGAQPHPLNELTTYPQRHLFPEREMLGRRTSIGNDVWIGSNSVILGGVMIGDGAVIGAGSVVTKNMPPYSISYGNPARTVRWRFPLPIIEGLLRTKWWEFPLEVIKELPFKDVKACIARLDELRKVAA
jgi:acetyltransferase-like isoleucine patch superfamily enzyme